jgi:hypothetical protein
MEGKHEERAASWCPAESDGFCCSFPCWRDLFCRRDFSRFGERRHHACGSAAREQRCEDPCGCLSCSFTPDRCRRRALHEAAEAGRISRRICNPTGGYKLDRREGGALRPGGRRNLVRDGRRLQGDVLSRWLRAFGSQAGQCIAAVCSSQPFSPACRRSDSAGRIRGERGPACAQPSFCFGVPIRIESELPALRARSSLSMALAAERGHASAEPCVGRTSYGAERSASLGLPSPPRPSRVAEHPRTGIRGGIRPARERGKHPRRPWLRHQLVRRKWDRRADGRLHGA